MLQNWRNLLFDGQRMPFSLLKKNSWSMKYNMVWDVIFSSHLFNQSCIDAELKWYKTKNTGFWSSLRQSGRFIPRVIGRFGRVPLILLIDSPMRSPKKWTAFLEISFTKSPFGDWYNDSLSCCNYIPSSNRARWHVDAYFAG